MAVVGQKKYNLDLKKCVVIGDKKCDVDWGRKAGSKTILVLTGYGKRASASTRARAHHISRTLPHAAEWILKNEP